VRVAGASAWLRHPSVLAESRETFRDRKSEATICANERDFGMKRRHPSGCSLSALFALVLSAIALLHGPTSATAKDKILPLKIKVGVKAPDFVLPSADGKMVRLSDYAGHNVLIDFYRGYW
jgi:AhpC/TSA family